MGDFTCIFGERAQDAADSRWESVRKSLRDSCGDDGECIALRGGWLCLASSHIGRPRLFVDELDNWIVVKGTVFRVDRQVGKVDPPELLTTLTSSDSPDLSCLEGTFSLTAWDARRKRGWVLNDQSAILNVYYMEHGGRLLATTTAVPLAKALGLSLDGSAVREFLGRGSVMAPRSLFRGLRRLGIGEVVEYVKRGVVVRQSWSPFRRPAPFRNIQEAASELGRVAADRMRRYYDAGNSILSDLSGGLDSRLVVAAGHAAGLDVGLTVNGSDIDRDVVIASAAARRLDMPLLRFDPALLLAGEASSAEREELTTLTAGELPFSSIRLHRIIRPQTAALYSQHVIGIGGDFVRYHPWGQEFVRVGRMQRPDLARLLDYRFLQVARPNPDIFLRDFYPALRADMARQLVSLFEQAPGCRNTQYLDAAHLWKLTGHTSLFLSSVFNWMPTGAPLQSAGFLEVALSVPWKMRLTSHLQRRVIHSLYPELSYCVTAYGSTAAPVRIRDLHREALQVARRAEHLIRKVVAVQRMRRMAQRTSGRPGGATLAALVASKDARTRGLYKRSRLLAFLDEGPKTPPLNEAVLTRMATLETVCQIIGLEPSSDILLDS